MPMPRFVVHENQVQGPATHALVIGVGAYPHLLGGNGALSGDNEGLGQLTSPPFSARAFADWLIKDFCNPAKRLASVALLVSEADNVLAGKTSKYVNPQTGVCHDLERAKIDTIADAVGDWKARADGNDENMTLFYFCGHGIAQAADAALLTEDFGAKPDDALAGAIDFRKFHLGMNRCAASQQCYFVDACRASSDMLIENREYAGRPLVQIVKNARRGKPSRQGPVFYASLGGDLAYARPNKPSVFTEALIRSFKGAGSDDEDGDWRVTTTRLLDALDYYMRQEFDGGGKQVQIPATGDQSKVQIHYVQTPAIPVEVWCKPDGATAHADLACLHGGVKKSGRPPTNEKRWLIELQPGEYEFKATFPGNQYRDATAKQYVRPAYRVISLQVQP
jgi:hypothetical protein